MDERPAEVETRLIDGHYEGDLIVGEGNRSVVEVFDERTSRYTMLCPLPAKDAISVRESFTLRLIDITQFRLSLTYDQSKGMAQHKNFAADLRLNFFFCHPHSPWAHGTCKNQNGRICQYLPKGTDLSTVSIPTIRYFCVLISKNSSS